MAKKILTLSIVHEHPRILLAMKKRGFGAGKWNGLSGKVEEGETIEDAARREAKEEGGIDIGEMEKVGVVDFEFRGDPKILEVHIFKVARLSAIPSRQTRCGRSGFILTKFPTTRCGRTTGTGCHFSWLAKNSGGGFFLMNPGARQLLNQLLIQLQNFNLLSYVSIDR